MQVALIPWAYDEDDGWSLQLDGEFEMHEFDRAQFIEHVIKTVSQDKLPHRRFEFAARRPQIKESWFPLVMIDGGFNFVMIEVDDRRQTHVHPLDGESISMARVWLEREVMEF